jgi:hypothetical protein
MPMHVRQWWFITESGSVALTIKYGSKVLEIAKGKNAIEVSDGTQLLKALNQVLAIKPQTFFTDSDPF